MERIVICVSNRLDGLEKIARAAPDLLSPAPPSGDAAWGLAYRQGDEILSKKRPLRATERLDIDELFRNVQTDRAFLHLGQPTPRGFAIEDVGPHRFEHFAFTCIGGEHATSDGAVLPSLDFFARRNPAQAMFARLLTSLGPGGLAGEPTPAAVRAGFREIAPPHDRFSAVFGNGRRTYVYARRDEVAHLRVDEPVGAPEANEPPFFATVVVLGDVERLPSEFHRAPTRDVFGVVGPDGALELGEA